MKKHIVIQAILLAAAAVTLKAEPIIRLTPPDGAISALPGATTGWGFSVTASPTYWSTIVGTVLLGETNPGLGIYTDLISSQGGPSFGALAPGNTVWSQSFNAALGLGFASYQIDPSAPMGDTNSGTILVLYELYSDNPATCGGACFVDTRTTTLDFSVSAVPEPSTNAMLGLALTGAAFLVRRQRRR